MKQVLVMSILFLPIISVAQNIRGQMPNTNNPHWYYRNIKDPESVCDTFWESVCHPAKGKNYEDETRTPHHITYHYGFKDTANHPLFSCKHRGSYRWVRTYFKNKLNEWQDYERNYCDFCNKEIKVFYLPISEILCDVCYITIDGSIHSVKSQQ